MLFTMSTLPYVHTTLCPQRPSHKVVTWLRLQQIPEIVKSFLVICTCSQSSCCVFCLGRVLCEISPQFGLFGFLKRKTFNFRVHEIHVIVCCAHVSCMKDAKDKVLRSVISVA